MNEIIERIKTPPAVMTATPPSTSPPREPDLLETYLPDLSMLFMDASVRPDHYGSAMLAAIEDLRAGREVPARMRTDLVVQYSRRTKDPKAEPRRAEPRRAETQEEKDLKEADDEARQADADAEHSLPAGSVENQDFGPLIKII